MAKSRKALRDEMKEVYLKKLIDFFKESEEVLRVKSNEIAFPIVDSEGNEDFMVITLKIPTGANKGTEPYDGYSMAEEYEVKKRESGRKGESKSGKNRKGQRVSAKESRSQGESRSGERGIISLFFF